MSMLKKGECQVQRELEDLVTDLKSTLITKRLKAVKALGCLKTPLAVEPLQKILEDRSKEVRCAVIEALVRINPPHMSGIILPLARDRSADVRLRVAHALGIGNTGTAIPSREATEGQGTVGTVPDADAINGLFDLLRDQKDAVAMMAARSLARYPRATMAPLVRQFSDKSWKIRSRSATAVTCMGKEAVEALRVAMNDRDVNIRFWSTVCLGHLRDRTHVRDLLTKLQDPDTGVRIACLRALREIGDPSVVGHLFAALSQPSEQVRDLIYEMLKDFGTSSIPFLMESLSSEFWMGRSLAARALTEMGGEAVIPLSQALEGENKERRFWAIKILGHMQEESAFSEIRRCLADSDSEIRMVSVQAISNFRRADTIHVLIERFIDPSWVVRKEAAQALQGFGSMATPALIKALSSPEEDVRYWALRTLGTIKPPGLFPELVRLFKDRSWNVRRTASDIMGTYGEQALMELTSLATEADAEVRFWVLQSLGRIGSSMSLPLLYRALEDGSESIRNAAQKALANYGATIVDDLFALFKSDKRRLLESVVATFQYMPSSLVVPRLVQALGKFDEHVSYWIRQTLTGFATEATPAIRKLLDSKAHEVRRQAILAFARIGCLDDVEQIISHLKDESWPARIAAAETLGFLGSPDAVHPLLDAIEDDDEDLALAAIKALGRIGDDRAVPGLITTLQRESWSLKYQAVSILGDMKVRRAVPDLLRTLDEDTLDLRIPIIRALGRIGHGDGFNALHERFVRETETDVRAVYIEAFGSLPNPQIVPLLIDLSKPEQPWPERRAAIRALGVLRAPEAKAPLLQALRDPDQIVSREALSALRSIMTTDEFRQTEEARTNALRRQEMFQQNFQEGVRHLRQGALAEAEKSLRAAARINPKAGYVYSALGNLYYKTGRLIDATKAYVMAVTIEPRDATLRLNLGMVYYRRMAFREAFEVFGAMTKMVDSKSQQGLYAVKMQQKIKLEAARHSVNLKE